MKSEIIAFAERVENILAVPTRRPDEVPSVHNWKNYDFRVFPPKVVSEEINDFSLDRLASDLYWFFSKVGSQGVKQVVPVLRQLVEKVRAEEAVANGRHDR